MMGPLLITYAFPVILAEMYDTSVFAIANVSALGYAALAWSQSKDLSEVGIKADQQIAFVVMAFLVFNFLALYTNRYGSQLRNLTRHLQEKVAERTAALTATNRELGAKARALEEKQDELKDFVYTVTHDLKSPLSAILLTADLLLQREGDTLRVESREDLERIVRLAGGTEDMIRDLLELFRITSLPEAPTWVELGPLVARALETLAPQIAAKGIRVEVATLPRVWGEPRKLAHVVTNLLSNALKYVATGRGRVEVSGGADDGSVLLSVRDNGIGIARAYQRGIFDLFGRAPGPDQVVDGEAVAGTGVGLAIVKRIVEGHHGTVSVDSEPGAGSRFTVRLPAGRGD
jgi:signal transduction histidine kinase